MIKLIGLALLWLFLFFDVVVLHKTGADTAAGTAFVVIRSIPLIMVTMGE